MTETKATIPRFKMTVPMDDDASKGGRDMTDMTRKATATMVVATLITLPLVGCDQPTINSDVVSTGKGPITATDADALTGTKTKGTATSVDETDATEQGIWVPVRVTQRNDIGDGTRWISRETTYGIDDEGNIKSVRIEEDGTEDDDKRRTDISVDTDENGLVTRIVKEDADGKSSPKEVSFLYDRDSDGRIGPIEARHTISSSKVYALSYDDDGTLREVAGTGLTLSFDEDGRITSEVEREDLFHGIKGEYRFDYSYDEFGRLKKLTRVYPGKLAIGSISKDVRFELDDNGNILSTDLDMDGSSTHVTYEYQHVANPSEGAMLYWHGTSWLLTLL